MGRFAVANPLLVLVGAVASLLLAIGLLVRGQWFGFGGGMALAGYGLVALGLLLPPPKPRRAVRREKSGGGTSVFNPFAAGGIGLVGVLGVIGRGLGRVNGRVNQEGNGGGNALPGREFNPVGVAIGLGVFALFIGALVGLFMSIRRYGLYATLAPIYVGIGGLLGLLMVISIGSEVSRMPRGFRQPPQPPALRSVAEPVPSAAPVEILNTSPLTPLPAKPLNPRVREMSTLAGISRRTVTIDSPFGLKSITGTLEILEPAAAAGRLARPVAGAAKDSREHIGLPIDHIGVVITACGDQPDVFGDGSVGRAGPLAIDYLVKIVGNFDISRAQLSLLVATPCFGF